MPEADTDIISLAGSATRMLTRKDLKASLRPTFPPGRPGADGRQRWTTSEMFGDLALDLARPGPPLSEQYDVPNMPITARLTSKLKHGFLPLRIIALKAKTRARRPSAPRARPYEYPGGRRVTIDPSGDMAEADDYDDIPLQHTLERVWQAEIVVRALGEAKGITMTQLDSKERGGFMRSGHYNTKVRATHPRRPIKNTI